jgi:hypothetical protein
MPTEILQFNASAEFLDVALQRKAFFELAGILDVALEDAELKKFAGPIPIILNASQADVLVPLPAGMTTGKLLCIKTTDSITFKRNTTGGEAIPVGKWKATKPGGCMIGPTSFTAIYLTNSVAVQTQVELFIGGI